MSNPATVDETIAAIHALRAAGSKETEISDTFEVTLETKLTRAQALCIATGDTND